jgi:hypothetical protein
MASSECQGQARRLDHIVLTVPDPKPYKPPYPFSVTIGENCARQMRTFTDSEKIRELARRGEAWGTSEARQMLEHAIETGRGGIYLRLTPEQYSRLRRA